MEASYFNMKKFDAALFDLDGTLLNTQRFILSVFNHTLKHHGFPEVSWEVLRPNVGKPLEDCYQFVSGTKEVEKFIEVHKAFQKNNLHLSEPFEHALDTLRAFLAAGLHMAVVTSRGSLSVEGTLELANLREYFDVLITADDARHLKPHPEPVLKALALLRIEPEKAVMIGDTEFDILAGKSAGISTIGVTYGFGGDAITQREPDYLVSDIRHILPIIL